MAVTSSVMSINPLSPLKSCKNHSVLVINPASLVTLHVRVEAFIAPSKLPIAEPLGGSTKVANPRAAVEIFSQSINKYTTIEIFTSSFCKLTDND